MMSPVECSRTAALVDRFGAVVGRETPAGELAGR
jgi:hypothetical protein